MKLKDVDVRQVYRNWKLGSDAFESFVRSGPFVSLKTYEDFDLNMSFDLLHLQQQYHDILQSILNCKKDEFILCDFDFNNSLEIGFLLNNIFSIKPIISFNMLFHPYGLIGTKGNIENLVKYGLNLKKITPKGYVFMCDYGRYQDFKEDEYKKKLNNQYEICDADLPYVETLKILGYNKVVFFTEKDIKKDIQGYLNYIENSNVQIELKMI
jgi:hypothetical protein